MCFIGSSLPELFHNHLARIDNTPTLFGSQCRGGARAYELVNNNGLLTGKKAKGEKVTDLEKECSCEACPDEEKVWRIRCMADCLHII